jgi:phosphatidylserine/phosphatidylglycerophosphate/cardiolipin synthase-like enzyme
MTHRRFPFYLSLITTLIVAVTVVAGGCAPLESTEVPEVNPSSGQLQTVNFPQGFGAGQDFWQVYFTAPTGSSDEATYNGGVDAALISAIDSTQQTLDIAAFEWKNPDLTTAVINAFRRGVAVRMVIDDEHVFEDHIEALEDGEDSPFGEIIASGIPFVDDDRSGLMHNKFMIMDGTTIWTGSMNYTMNGTYRNNNNMLALRSRRAVQAYQAEFNEMFSERDFGSSRSPVNGVVFSQDGVPIQILFSPEDSPVPEMIDTLNSAQERIRFMTFSFTRDDVGETLLGLSQRGVDVEGIFEVRASRTIYSELPRLFCAGVPVFQDGNPFTFHHKVFIVDDHTVLTGSFNISNNATESNDENIVIIRDRNLAAQYLAEYERMRSRAEVPPRAEIECP